MTKISFIFRLFAVFALIVVLGSSAFAYPPVTGTEGSNEENRDPVREQEQLRHYWREQDLNEPAPHEVGRIQDAAPVDEVDLDEKPEQLSPLEREDAEASQFRIRGSLSGPIDSLEAAAWQTEPRASDRRLRLRPMEEIMDLEAQFARILDYEFVVHYSKYPPEKRRKVLERHIRKNLVGVFRDAEGNIRSYRDLYPAFLYEDEADELTEEISDAPAPKPSLEDAGNLEQQALEKIPPSEGKTVEREKSEKLAVQNAQQMIKTSERIEANALDVDRIEGPKVWNKAYWVKPSGPKYIIGKYNSGVQWKTRRGQANDCPIIFSKIPLDLNKELNAGQYEKSLHVYLSRISIDTDHRYLAVSLDEKNQVDGVLYQPRVKPFKGFAPNLKEYWSTWWTAKAVRATPERIRLAVISSLIQFGSGAAMTLAFKGTLALGPAVLNGLFALLICSHSGMYERVVKTGSAVWETFKRLLIGAPLGLGIAVLNHAPDYMAALSDPNTWIVVLLIGYMDRLSSTFMNRIPRMRSEAGINQGTVGFRIPIPTLPKFNGFTRFGFPKIQLFRMSSRQVMPRDDTEREIPAVLRNVPKFLGYLFNTAGAAIPPATWALLATIPPAELANYLYARANKDKHPKIWEEYAKRKSQFNLDERLEQILGTRERVDQFLKTMSTPESEGILDSISRRCKYRLFGLASPGLLGHSAR